MFNHRVDIGAIRRSMKDKQLIAGDSTISRMEATAEGIKMTQMFAGRLKKSGMRR
jgi:hypothetical protein